MFKNFATTHVLHESADGIVQHGLGPDPDELLVEPVLLRLDAVLPALDGLLHLLDAALVRRLDELPPAALVLADDLALGQEVAQVLRVHQLHESVDLDVLEQPGMGNLVIVLMPILWR